MASPKLLIALVLVAVVVAHTNGYLISGYRTGDDWVFCHHEAAEEFSFVNWLSNLRYWCVLSPEYVITEVLAVNQDQSNPDGVEVSIISGGPGHSSVNLLFRRLYFRGLNYTIDVFGQLRDLP